MGNSQSGQITRIVGQLADLLGKRYPIISGKYQRLGSQDNGPTVFLEEMIRLIK